MKRIKTASNIRFRKYTLNKGMAQIRLAEIGGGDIDTLRAQMRLAPEINLLAKKPPVALAA